MNRRHVCIRPTMIPVEPVLEYIRQGVESCPAGANQDPAKAAEPVILFRWFRFPRLRRQKGLATGIIGLW